jgi:microcystin synthetase protein McyA
MDVRQQLEYVEPRTPVEETLCRIWADVLNLHQVGIHDRFFDLGGDSILSIRIKAKAEAQGLEFPLQALFELQSVAELSQIVKETAVNVSQNNTEVFSLLSEADRLSLLEQENES